MLAPFCFKYRRITAGSRKRTDLTSPETSQLLLYSRTSRGVTFSMKTALAELRGRLTTSDRCSGTHRAHTRSRHVLYARDVKDEGGTSADNTRRSPLPSLSLSLCIVLAGEMQPPSERNSCQLRSSPRAELNNPSAVYYLVYEVHER